MSMGNNHGMALLEMLQAENKEAKEAHKEAKRIQTEKRQALLKAQQESQQADADVNETFQHLEATKQQVRTAIDSMSR